MERMEKQTAVEWLIECLEKLEYDLEKGNISLDDYIINTKWIKNRAKEKEKEHNEYFFNCGRNYQLTGEGTFTETYNETYGK